MILEANTYPSIKRSLPPRCRNFVHTQLRWETTKRRSWALWRRRCWRTRSSSTRWRIMWARTSPWLSTSLLGSRLLLRWRQFEIHQPQWWIHELQYCGNFFGNFSVECYRGSAKCTLDDQNEFRTSTRWERVGPQSIRGAQSASEAGILSQK